MDTSNVDVSSLAHLPTTMTAVPAPGPTKHRKGLQMDVLNTGKNGKGLDNFNPNLTLALT